MRVLEVVDCVPRSAFRRLIAGLCIGCRSGNVAEVLSFSDDVVELKGITE